MASYWAMVGDKARALFDKLAKERQKSAIKERDEKGRAKSTPGNLTGSGSDARDAAGKAVGVSGKLAKERMKVRKGDQPGATVETLPQLDSGKSRDAADKDATT